MRPCGAVRGLQLDHRAPHYGVSGAGVLVREEDPDQDRQPILLALGDRLDPAGNLDVGQVDARPRDVRQVDVRQRDRRQVDVRPRDRRQERSRKVRPMIASATCACALEHVPRGEQVRVLALELRPPRRARARLGLQQDRRAAVGGTSSARLTLPPQNGITARISNPSPASTVFGPLALVSAISSPSTSSRIRSRSHSESGISSTCRPRCCVVKVAGAMATRVPYSCMTPAPVDHDERRARLTEVLLAVVSEVGLEGASIRAVAARAGVSIGTVQHYFATKDEMLLYAYRHVGRTSATGRRSARTRRPRSRARSAR